MQKEKENKVGGEEEENEDEVEENVEEKYDKKEVKDRKDVDDD